ncbi:hypothetical protein ACN28E_01020 [Archangium lansingense]|uniref:hypothetical protein n=1 Tax=Archangium lansingense TaxID=2995310 RepID=UPI003B7F8D48
MRTCIAVLLLLFPQLALAGGLQLAAELPDVNYTNAAKVSAQRFVLVGVTWDRDEKNRPKMPHYELFDFQERKVIDVPVPLHQLPKAHTDTLGRTNPSATVVHHDGQVTSLTFNATKGYETVATYFCQYDHRTRQFSDLVLLGPKDNTRYFHDIGFDPTDTYLYYASAVNPAGNVLKDGYTSFELARIDLETRAIDWTMKVDFPKRDKPIKLVSGPKVFSPDGKKLALVEYNDKGNERSHPARPQQQVLVIDIPSKQVDSYPVPLTAYGTAFTPDNRYLLLGSNELGDVIRIDLEKKKIDAKTQGMKKVHRFVLTPSGKSFLVISNTQQISPKVIEVRRVSDLSLQTSIPMRMLFPGNDGVAAEAIVGLNGRMLMTPFVDEKGWPSRKGVRLYEVPDDVDSPEVAGSAGGDLKIAQGVVLGKQYADKHALRYVDYKVDPTATFAQFVVAPNGDVLLIGTLSGNTDSDYKPGRTKPVVARLDPTGKPRWQKVLVKKGFLDYEGGTVAATPDGGCVAQIVSYVHPGRPPVTRLVKLNAKGKVLWDHQFRGDGGPGTPLGDHFELLPDGSVLITGRYYDDVENKQKHDWKAVLDPNGKVVSEEASP